MHSATTTLRRLLQALEEIGFREDGALASGDGQAFQELEHKAEPLVCRIVALAESSEGITAELRERGQALVASRHERHLRLAHHLDTIRDEIGRLDEARSRIRLLGPAYASRRAPPRSSIHFTDAG